MHFTRAAHGPRLVSGTLAIRGVNKWRQRRLARGHHGFGKVLHDDATQPAPFLANRIFDDHIILGQERWRYSIFHGVWSD